MPWYIQNALTCFGLVMSLQQGLMHQIPLFLVVKCSTHTRILYYELLKVT
jgi:hypothetical protein